MPRWLKLLALITIVLASVVTLGYLVLEWRVEDPLEVHLVSVKGELGDITSTATYEVRNTSRFAVRVLDYAHAAHQDGEFQFLPTGLSQPVVMKSGSTMRWMVKMDWDLPATGKEEGTLHVFWTPPSARWLDPLFDSIHSLYMDVRPGARRFMPSGRRSVDSPVMKFRHDIGTAK